MRKMRDNSTWKQLTSEQRETLESWLFDENLGYLDVIADDPTLSDDEKISRMRPILFGWGRSGPSGSESDKSGNGI
jgi:hypothetical protein